jgi:hypothetical protein
MPMVSPCIEPGCSKLCMGLFCIDHDSGPRVDLPRGRPWPPSRRGVQAVVSTPGSVLEPLARVPLTPAV